MSTRGAVRAEALFASCLQKSQRPQPAEVRAAVVETLRRYGVRGCATAVAGEFGEHPESAVRRMSWALSMIHQTYGPAD